MAPPTRPVNPLDQGRTNVSPPIHGTPSRNNMSLGQIATAPVHALGAALAATGPQPRRDSSQSLTSVPKPPANPHAAVKAAAKTAKPLPNAPVRKTVPRIPPPAVRAAQPLTHPALPSTSGKTPAPPRTVTSKAPANPPVKTRPAVVAKPPRAPRRVPAQVPAPAAKRAPAGPPQLTPQQQAASYVTQALAPLYTQQTTSANQQNAAIRQFTQAIISQLQGDPSQVEGDYNTAIAQQSALANSAADALRNTNPNTQDQALLTAIGAPDAQQQQLADQNNQTFNGGAAVGQYVNGVLPMGALQAMKLAAVTQARQEPSLQGLRGQQALSSALAQEAQDRGKIDAMRPDLEQKYVSSLTASQAAAQKATVAQQNARVAQQQKQQYLDMVASKFGYQVKKDNRSYGLAVTKANNATALGTARIKSQDARAAAQLNKINPGVSKLVGYVATADGTPITRNGKVVTVNTTTGAHSAAKLPTAGQLNTMVQTWKNGKVQNVNVQQPNPDSNGNPVYKSVSTQVGKLSFGQAYRRLRAMKVPDKNARNYLDSAYMRGEQGRAWVTNEEQTALVKAKLPPRARVIQGHGVLSTKQYGALVKAGLHPPGTMTTGGFVIDQTY